MSGSNRVANHWEKERGFEKLGSTIRSAAYNLNVGALGLDVARLLALVADLLAGTGLLGAVAGQMARDTAVVALVAIHAVTGHVANATARVAGLLAEATTATVAGVEATAVGRALGAVASNVTDLAALVALSTRLAAGLAAAGGGAVAGDVVGLAAAVAGLGILGALGAVTAHVTLATAVVALGGTLVGAVAGLMGGLAASEAGASLVSEIHVKGWLGLNCCLGEVFWWRTLSETAAEK